jgi:hypothetical protein
MTTPIELKFWIGFIWDATFRNLNKRFNIMDFFGIVAHARSTLFSKKENCGFSLEFHNFGKHLFIASDFVQLMRQLNKVESCKKSLCNDNIQKNIKKRFSNATISESYLFVLFYN